MTANLFINGVIGAQPWDENPDDTGTTLADVRRQFESYHKPDRMNVFINSPGGNIADGFAIHDFLRAQGIPITTIGEGRVYSIATVILLAGDKRLLAENAEFLIHNPMPSMGVHGDAQAFEEMAERLRAEESRIVDFYAKKTGQSVDQLRAWMNEETKFSVTEARAAGFVDEVYERLAAVAFVLPEPNSKNMNDDQKSLIEQIKSLFKNQAPPVVEPVVEPEIEPEIDVEAVLAENETLRAEITALKEANARKDETLATIEAKMLELEKIPIVAGKKDPAIVVKKEPMPHRFDRAAETIKNQYR